jgi:hypothetical protein
MIIGIYGPLRSGKDTLAQLLIEDNQTYKRRAFADKVKEIVTSLAGVPLAWAYEEDHKNEFLPLWGMTLGNMLQQVGTNALREHFDQDVWVKATLSDYVPTMHLVIPDMRFPNECDAIRERGGILVKITGDPSGQGATSTRDKTHPSETALLGWTDWDYQIVNDGTLHDLRNHVGNILRIAHTRQLRSWN